MGKFFHKKRIIYTVLAMATIPAVMFLFVAFKPASAINIILRPTGDTDTHDWIAVPSSTHFTAVDDEVTQPTVANISDYIAVAGFGRNGVETEEFTVGTKVSDSGNVNQLDLWLYVNDMQCRGGGQNNCDQLRLSFSGTPNSALNLLASNVVVFPPVGSYDWIHIIFSVPNDKSVPFDDIRGIRVNLRRIANGGGNNNDEIRVAALYVEVSYNPDFARGGGGAVVESSTTQITATKTGGSKDFGGGKKSVLEGETTTTAPAQSGATRYDGGALTP